MRRLFSLAAVLGLLVVNLNQTIVTDRSCEECESYCNSVPMDPGDCIDLYCPGC